MEIKDYPDREMMMLAVADRIAGDLGSFLRRGDHATLCVPGGTTSGPVFDILSGVDLDWAKVTVLPTDERWVPHDDPRSNAGQISSRLLCGRAAAARFLSLYADEPTPEAALPVLTEAVLAALPISVLLLGMGADMHIASLFPGGDRLQEALANNAPPVLPMRAAAAPEPRITLTKPVLAGAMHVHLVITGSDKRAAVERASGLSTLEAPVRIVLDVATVHWAE